jgi:hypothetical protein
MFKKYNVDVSVSQYVNSCLHELLSYLNDMEDTIKINKAYQGKNLMPYVINKKVKKQPGIDCGSSIPYDSYISLELDSIDAEFESRKRRHTVLLYQLTKQPTSPFKLSKDGAFLINKRTGQKFKTFKTSDGLLSVDLSDMK